MLSKTTLILNESQFLCWMTYIDFLCWMTYIDYSYHYLPHHTNIATNKRSQSIFRLCFDVCAKRRHFLRYLSYLFDFNASLQRSATAIHGKQYVIEIPSAFIIELIF